MGPVDREAAAAAEGASQRAAWRGARATRPTAEAPSARREDGSGPSGGEEAAVGRGTRDAAKPGETASAGTDYEGRGRFSGIVAAVGKGKGAKKRKMLAERLAAAWRERDMGDGTMPAVPVLEIYRRMSGSMTSGVVRTELKGLSSAGLVALRDDEVVYVAEARSEVDGASGSSGAGGAERASARKQGRAGSGEGGSGRGAGDGDDEEVGGLAGGARQARGWRREGGGSKPVYAESEQETDESS